MTTLLAVDDSNTMRKVIEITFAGEDFDTVLASSADEAIERLYQASPEIALVDVSLGTDDGYDLCQRIKGERPTTRVLLLSSKQHPYDAARAAAVGADDHMDKPFDTQSMIDKVKALAAAPAKAAEAAPPIAPAPAPIQPARPEPADAQPEPEIPVLEPESAVVVEPEELEAVTIEPPPSKSAPPPREIPAAPPAAAQARPSVRPTPAPSAEPVAAPPSAAPSARPAASANGASLEGRLKDLGLTPEQVAGVLALSKEVVEQAVWEVVPSLAEALIKEEIARLTK